MKYSIKIESKDNQFRFVVLPPNNKKQPLGVSPFYDTKGLCTTAREEFVNLVRNNNLQAPDERHIKVDSYDKETILNNGDVIRTKKYKFFYYDANNTLILYRELGFERKSNCLQSRNRLAKKYTFSQHFRSKERSVM